MMFPYGEFSLFALDDFEEEKHFEESKKRCNINSRINDIVSDIRAGLQMEGKRSCEICKRSCDHIFEDSEKE